MRRWRGRALPGRRKRWSHESSLPVSRTMVTLCGGVPTVSETVKVTLWWNESLREEGVGTETNPCESVWDIRGNMRGPWGEEVVVWIWIKTVKRLDSTLNCVMSRHAGQYVVQLDLDLLLIGC
ncbi:hypothetical protein ACSQ67_002141 [Phaseolus vulgaris]